MSKNVNNIELQLEKQFLKLYGMSIEMTQRDLELAYIRKDILIQIRNNHCNMKPYKFLKNDYYKWNKKLKEIDELINKINNNIEALSNEYYDLIYQER